jgi:hypothetical protein
LAIERIADRVRSGGHGIPADVVRRRYSVGIRNFFRVYQPVATSWVLYNSSGPQPTLVAEGLESQPQQVYDMDVWATAHLTLAISSETLSARFQAERCLPLDFAAALLAPPARSERHATASHEKHLRRF